ncbi:universal stress protein [Acetobacter okinawensis]|uniref:universal stress protein n=1 Tax=Acetobacter okinawensis TaxID=1076594 RepID=UPI00131F1A7F
MAEQPQPAPCSPQRHAAAANRAAGHHSYGGTPARHAPDPALLAQLRASGVAVALERFALAGSGVGAQIRTLATQAGADLLVMGAYGRPHFVEWLFGGPTVDLLASATWPILTQH